MTPEQWEQVRELFHEALDLSADKRQSFLAARCPDAKIRAEAEKLLAEANDAPTLDRPPADFALEAVRLVSDPGRELLAVQLAGSTVSERYRIESCIGKGGHAVVFLATDTRVGNRKVVVKVLNSGGDAHEWLEKKFRQEIEVLAKISHTGVVGIFDCGELESGHPFLVMNFIEGMTLRQRIQTPVTHAEAADIVRQIGSALGAAHRLGVVHCDLKPENVMLAAGGDSGPMTVKLIDFGIARVRDGGALGVATAQMVSGTANYMAPEQFRGVSSRETDIYALGVVCFELLTGSLPQAAQTFEGIPRAIQTTLKSALEADPEKRPHDAGAVGEALAEGLAGVPLPENKRGWRRHRAAVAVAAAALICTTGFVAWQRAQPKPLLTDKDVLVMADFTNSTSNPVFDGALKAALSIQLEQSPFLQIMDEQTVQQGLRLMGRQPAERITNDIAREVCIREGDKAFIGGSIASLGTRYAVSLEATNCQTGAKLARVQNESTDKEHVLQSLSEAAREMRGKLGESLSSIQKLDRSFGPVTTASLEAFQTFYLGKEQRSKGSDLAAIPLFIHATELDPNFAAAYLALSQAYNGIPDVEREDDAIRKAFALIDRVSEKERLEITANYYYRVTGELAKAQDTFHLLESIYPRSQVAHNMLGGIASLTGDFEEAVRESQEAIRLSPDGSVFYSTLASDYIDLDQFDASKKWIGVALGRKLANPNLRLRLLRIAYITGDAAGAAQQLQWAAGKPQEYRFLTEEAIDEDYFGHRTKARDLLRRAGGIARQRNLDDAAAQIVSRDALSDALAGQCGEIRPEALSALARGREPADSYSPVLSLAFCGGAAAAERDAADISKRFPLHTLWNSLYLPSVQAVAELQRGRPERAIALLEAARPYERTYSSPIYIRGLACLALRQGPEAAFEFRKILDHKGIHRGIFFPLAQAGFARATVLSGDTAGAKRAYEDFFTLWKDADPGLPLLAATRGEYAALK